MGMSKAKHHPKHSKYGVIIDISELENSSDIVAILPEQAVCIECERATSVVTSHKCRRFNGLGIRDGYHPTLKTPDGQPVKVVVQYPIFKLGRICAQCFTTLHIENGKWLNPHGVEIIILFEGKANEILETGESNQDPVSIPHGDVMVMDGELVIIPSATLNKPDRQSYAYFIQGKRGKRSGPTTDHDPKHIRNEYWRSNGMK